MRTCEVIVFDVETTGTDRRKDQVIELCVQFGLQDSAENQVWRFRPSVPIHPAAQEVHGISMDDLADCPEFGRHGDEIRRIFAEAHILVGYNLEFDIGMLQAEFQRLGQPLMDLQQKIIIDAFRLWQQCEPRTLQNAHARFVGQEFASAHSAAADVAATGRVLLGMLQSFGLAGQDWSDIAQVCEPERGSWLGPSKHLQWNDEGIPVMGFGKHQGKALHQLAQSSERNYLRWITEKDFPVHVRQICAKALELAAEPFWQWVRDNHGQPPNGQSAQSAQAAQSAQPAVAKANAVSVPVPDPSPDNDRPKPAKKAATVADESAADVSAADSSVTDSSVTDSSDADAKAASVSAPTKRSAKTSADRASSESRDPAPAQAHLPGLFLS